MEYFIDNPSKINTIIDLTHSFKNMNGTKNDIICVISALSKVTDKILSLTDPIMKGNRDSIKIFIDKMTSIHIDLIEKTITNDSLKLEAKRIVLSILAEFHDILNGLVLISEITPRSLDQLLSFGERLMAPIVCYCFLNSNLKSDYFTGKDIGIVTDSNFGESRPLMDTTKLRVNAKILPMFRQE